MGIFEMKSIQILVMQMVSKIGNLLQIIVRMLMGT